MTAQTSHTGQALVKRLTSVLGHVEREDYGDAVRLYELLERDYEGSSLLDDDDLLNAYLEIGFLLEEETTTTIESARYLLALARLRFGNEG